MPQHIFIVAGDLSGEMHAARLVESLKTIQPALKVTALGGKHLEKVSDSFLGDLVHLSAFGFLAAVRLYFKLRGLLKDTILRSWDKQKPDQVILVDYYGFNIHIAAEAHKRGIPVTYYISPQVWASRPGRLKKLARYVTRMLVILPFEEELYRKAGVQAVFVGHPLLDTVPAPAQEKTSAAQRPVIGLFPGSRRSVVGRHLELLRAVKTLVEKEVPCDFKVFGVPPLAEHYRTSPFPVIYEDGFSERQKIDIAVTVSGTVSLENALLGIPMIVMYKLAPVNYLLARLLVKVRFITMANILAQKEIVPELIQGDATAENIARHLLRLLKDARYRQEMKDRLAEVRSRLGTPGVSMRAARIILGE